VPAPVPKVEGWTGQIAMLKRSGIPFRHIPNDGSAGSLLMIEYRVMQDKGDDVVVVENGKDVLVKKADLVLQADAIVYYTEQIDKDPANVMAYAFRGWAWKQKKSLDNALKDINDTIRLSYFDLAGWNSRGIMPEPRFGFAWDLLGDHKTVLRGGAGMMHDRTQGNLIFNTVFNNPALVQTAAVGSGNIVNLPTLQSSFGNSVLTNILGAAKNGKVPTVYSFSLGVQHEIAKGTTFDVAYVGTMSRHLVTARDINTIPYGYAFTLAAQDPNACGWNGTVGTDPYLLPEYTAAGLSFSGVCALGHGSYTNAPLVPYKGYGQIQYLQFDGTSNYNSLQASLQRRFSKDLTLGVAYTWSKSLTTASSDQDMQDAFNPRGLDYRAGSWDRTHVFAANYVYDLPNLTKHFGGPKWLSYVTDNFQLSGVTNFQTGAPIDLSNFWQGEPGAQTGGNMWGAVANYYTLDNNLNAVYPTIGAPIRGSRDLLRTGGLQNWDTSLFKNIPLTERYSVQLRLEVFNVFNHPNFIDKNVGFSENGNYEWQPGTAFSIAKNSNWGTNADTPGTAPGGYRVLQLGAKFYF
jgi:hypothetical protein